MQLLLLLNLQVMQQLQERQKTEPWEMRQLPELKQQAMQQHLMLMPQELSRQVKWQRPKMNLQMVQLRMELRLRVMHQPLLE